MRFFHRVKYSSSREVDFVAFRLMFGCRQGATSIEYALVGALVAVTAITGIHAFSASMGDMYEKIRTVLQE